MKIPYLAAMLFAFSLPALPSGAAPAAPASIKSERRLPRALWVWDATVITNAKTGEQLFDFCARKGISVVYLSVGDVFSARGREATDPKHVTTAQLGAFIQSAHARKIEVEALDGDPDFALQPKHSEALGIFQKALAYNEAAPAGQKLDGFQWDTEPYLLPDFNKDAASQRAISKQFLDSVGQMRDAAKASAAPMRLGFALPAFFDEADRALEWNGATKAPVFHVLDILNTLPAGYLAIMAYRDKAFGPNGTIELSRGEIEYAAKSAPKVKVWIGQETLDPVGDPPSISFWRVGENSLEAALTQIQNAYKETPTLAGLAIHHWDSYRVLKAGEPVVPVAETPVVQAPVATAPITEPLSILTPRPDAAVPRRLEVTGTAKPGDKGVKIEVAVRPAGDIWYLQGETALKADGTWSVTSRFGNENTPAGSVFEVRAQLKTADGTLVAEQIVKVKTD